MATISEYAAEYVNNGWSILPVRPDEKRPYMSNWLQYQNSRTTPDMVDSWFSNLTGAGIGLVTGKISNVVVLDVEEIPEPDVSEVLWWRISPVLHLSAGSW